MSSQLSPSREELEEAVEAAAEGGDVAAVYLFGSAARGKFVRGLSDVDLLAVRGRPHIGPRRAA